MQNNRVGNCSQMHFKLLKYMNKLHNQAFHTASLRYARTRVIARR